jgi:hypothetical protein
MQEQKKAPPKRETVFEYQVTLGSGDAARTYLVRLPERLPKGNERKRLAEMLEKNELTPYEKGKLVLRGDVTMVPKDAQYAKEYNSKPQNARLDIFHDRYIGDEREGTKIVIAELPKVAKEKKG